MHFIVSWDIKASNPEWNRLNEGMKEILKPYSWARPLTTLYIVNVQDQTTWNNILTNLQNYCNINKGKIDFIMSPLMSGGRYDGILNKEMWDEINKRSN